MLIMSNHSIHFQGEISKYLSHDLSRDMFNQTIDQWSIRIDHLLYKEEYLMIILG